MALNKDDESSILDLNPAKARSLADGFASRQREGDGTEVTFNELASNEALRGLGHYAYLVVDLGVSDDFIKRDFAEWLREFRRSKQLKRISTFTEQTFEKWHEFKILPYFDLCAWALWTGCERPGDFALRDLLFVNQPEFTVDGQLRTTKNTAEYVVTWSTHDALTDQLKRSGLGSC